MSIEFRHVHEDDRCGLYATLGAVPPLTVALWGRRIEPGQPEGYWTSVVVRSGAHEAERFYFQPGRMSESLEVFEQALDRWVTHHGAEGATFAPPGWQDELAEHLAAALSAEPAYGDPRC